MRKLNKSYLAIMAVFFISAGGSAVNPVINKIIEAFPDVSVALVRLVSTLPTLTGMFITLTVGAVVGTKIKYRTICLIGIVCYIIGGIGPAFLSSNIYIILLFRAIFGIATGCFGCRNAYLLTTVEKERQAKMIGNGQVVQNAGAAILQLVCGVLADIRWNLAFYPFFVAFFALFMVYSMMMEPEMETETKSPETAAANDAAPPLKAKLGVHFLIYVVIQFLVMLHAMPVLTGMSTLLAERNLGTAATAGVILAICQLGGLLTGVIFGPFVKVFRRYTMPVSLFIQGLGIFLMLVFDSVFMIGLGVLLSGTGTILIVSANMTWTGQSVTKVSIAFATSIVIAVGNIGSFISPYWISITHALFGGIYSIDVESVFLSGCICLAVLVVLTTIFNVSAKPPVEMQSVPEQAD